MKFKLTAIILALAVSSWAQTATSPKPNSSQPSTPAVQETAKADCPCCQKMADGKATESCCAHHQDRTAKSEMPCCKGKDKEGKDAMSCMKGDKGTSADACCSNGKSCSGDAKEGCCSKADKTTEHAAMACCGANGEHCGMAHHDHGDINK